jgi:Acyl-CoA synthetases (AMP-forming)/AMP-acid ligases II
MSNLTKKLQQQLITGATRPLMQDANKHWYNGNELNLEKTTWLTYWNNQGIGHNDIVLVSLSNSVTYSIVMESLWEIGAIAHPINPATTDIQLSELEEQYNYSALILNHEAVEPDDLKNTFMAKPRLTTLHEPEVQIFIRRIHESHAAKVSEDNNLAIIMHTSGTTGTPKRVGLTHEQLCDNALNIKTSQKLTDKDKTIILMPMFHVNAMVISNLATRLSGGQILFRERFSAHNFWSEISQEQVTWASLTPAIIEILLQRPEQPFNTKLRFLRTASAPLLPSTHDSFNNRFDVPLIESYGMTEAASQIAQNPLDDPRQNSVGKVLGPEIKIIDSNGNELEKNPSGRSRLKG